MTGWESVIRTAAVQRFNKTGDAGPFLLARRDLYALCRELGGLPPETFSVDGFLKTQARVYVPELSMQVVVDEWAKLETP